MIVKKVLNNNAVVVLDENNVEKVCFGKGIGFDAKKNSKINLKKISQIFALQTDSMYENLIQNIPFEYFEVANNIINKLKEKTKIELKDSLNFTLADHLYGIVLRMQNANQIKNELLFDLKHFYKQEFDVALDSQKLIEEKFGIKLNEDEIGFIALHLINGELNSCDEINKISKITQEIQKVVRLSLNLNIDTNTFEYNRFITHCKYFAWRLLKSHNHKNECKHEKDIFLDFIKNEYQKAYETSNKVREFLKTQYKYLISENEILYLTIHIQRLISTML